MDFGVIIGLIAVSSGALVLGLSYVGAYFVGFNRARREMERDRCEHEREHTRDAHAERILMVESSLGAIAQALERLTDAQRLVLLEQARAAAVPARPAEPGRVRQYNTPA